MNRGVSIATLALLLALAAPLAAQMQMRVDRSTDVSDPDDTPDVTFTTVGSGFQIATGPAVVAWDPAHTATGTYTLRGKFTLLAPSGHTNYYGLVFGGSDLGGGTAGLGAGATAGRPYLGPWRSVWQRRIFVM